jgi:acetoin utilization deacetylase AcuC-like enzyme
LKLFYSDTFELPLPDRHRFPMAKYTLLRERILSSEVGNYCQLLLPPAATDEELKLVHTVDYLESIKTGQLSALQQRRIGFPWSLEMVERSRRSTGASIAAARAAIDQGIAGNLAGGTHHSFADSGQGYCVFNDVCVAAKVMQANGLISNALVLDCDVHQGNGTASICQTDQTIFTFSMHCHENYPFKKTNGDLDIALPPNTGDNEYLDALNSSLNSIFDRFDPQLVFYLAGADPFSGDRLGRLSLSKSGLQTRDEIVFNFCRNMEIPVAFAMAGGYAPDLDDIVDIHFATIESASERYQKDLISV